MIEQRVRRRSFRKRKKNVTRTTRVSWPRIRETLMSEIRRVRRNSIITTDIDQTKTKRVQLSPSRAQSPSHDDDDVASRAVNLSNNSTDREARRGGAAGVRHQEKFTVDIKRRHHDAINARRDNDRLSCKSLR